MSRITFTAERIAEMQATEIEIAERLGWTLDDISKMMYENGVAFLQEFFKNIPVMAKMMEGERMFWNWWKNEWHIRNVEFIEDLQLSMYGIGFQRIAYQAHNDGKALSGKIQPARVVYVKILPTLKRAS